MKILAGKTALVTGAASGIGRALALRLAREGMRLELADVDETGLNQVVGDIHALGVEAAAHLCDLRRPEQISALVRRLLDAGGVDLVVNNAGVAVYGPMNEMSAEHWDRVLSINLLAPVQIIRELLPSLLARGEAHILNVGSIAGLIALPRVGPYTVSKFGLQGLSESLRVEYNNHGLGVTALCPGFASTGIYRAAELAGSPRKPKRVADYLMTTPEYIAERAVAAIRKNQPIVVITLLAHLWWRLKRLSPAFFLWCMSRKGPSSKKPPAALPREAPGGAAKDSQ